MANGNTRESGGIGRVAPGRPGDPLIGHLRFFGRDALGFLMSEAREHGPVVRFRLGPKVAHLVTEPSGIQHILQDNYKNYAKGRPYARARFAFGEGLITADGEKWRRHRKLIQPAFHKQHFAGFAKIMAEEAARMVLGWSPDAGPVNVAKSLRSVALRITARCLFTTDIEGEVGALERSFNEVQLWFTKGSRTGYLVPPSFPTPANLRLKKTLREIDDRLFAMIEKRHRASDKPGDLLSMLMAARDEEDGSALTDAELRDEVMTLMFAAHESTAASMTWTLYLLSKYPEAERRVRAEVGEALGSEATPTFENLGRMPYLRRVVDETLRLYPAAPLIPRDVLADDTVLGFAIPAGSVVFVSPYVTHRDPAHWSNPEAFDPDRFLPEEVAKRHKFAYLPFVLGPRQCIGNHFALTEMMMVLPSIVRRFHFELVPGLPVRSAHLRFDEGMWMSLQPGEGARARGEVHAGDPAVAGPG